MLFALAVLVALAYANTLCSEARKEYRALQTADFSYLSADSQRRLTILRDTLTACNTPDGRVPKSYKRPYGGRREIISKVNGEKQYAVRRKNGQFQDIQSIKLSKQRELRRTHVQGADRESSVSVKASAPVLGDYGSEINAPAPREYKRPYGGRREIILKVNGEKQYAVRRKNGQFQDIQSIKLSKQRELRRTHVQGADREAPFDAAAYRARRERELEQINKELGGGMGRMAQQDFQEATEEEIRRRSKY